jgi:hypothetical protein
VVREAVDTALWEILTACFAGMRIAVAIIIELRAALKVLQNEAIRTPAHYEIQEPLGS